MLIYFNLFFLSFLAGSFVPLGSEAYLVYLKAENYNSNALLFWASLGNTFGGMTCFYIAKFGGIPLIKKYLKQGDQKIQYWQKIVKGRGEWLTLFCWLPFVGELIASTAGLLGYQHKRIWIYMFIGKAVRYAFLLYLSNYFFT